MAETVQKQQRVIDNSVLEARDGVMLFPICQNPPKKEKTS